MKPKLYLFSFRKQKEFLSADLKKGHKESLNDVSI